MPKAFVVQQPGGIEALELKNIAEPKDPGPDQVVIRHTAIGINYMDIDYRSGLYKMKQPFIPGMEACGVVEKIGEGVDIPIGARVAYATVKTGAYAEKRLINQNYLVAVPDVISDEVAAASLVKGMTAHYLLHRVFRVMKDDPILIQAAAGGVGQFMVQWAKNMKAVVIGTAGGKQKIDLIKRMGCDLAIDYTQESCVEKTMALTKNLGVRVAYDSVGKTTFQQSMKCVGYLGTLVSFGQSSGPVPPMNVMQLAAKNIFITRPTLMVYKMHRLELALSAREVFMKIADKSIYPPIHDTYAFEDIPKIHQQIQARQTMGACVVKL